MIPSASLVMAICGVGFQKSPDDLDVVGLAGRRIGHLLRAVLGAERARPPGRALQTRRISVRYVCASEFSRPGKD